MLDRGQSEPLGFVLLFGLLVGSMGLVAGTATPVLEEQRTTAEAAIVERSVVELASTAEALIRQRGRRQSVGIPLNGGNLHLGATSRLELRAPDRRYELQFVISGLDYIAGNGDRIRYTQGAVIRGTGDRARMVREPPLLLTANRTVLSIVTLRPARADAVRGHRTTRVGLRHERSTVVLVDEAPPAPVWLNLSSSTSVAWRAVLESTRATTNCFVEEATLACQLATDRLYVIRVVLDVVLG